MKEIFEVAAAILASLGGGAAIVFGLSSWLGKVWANRILEKEKSEHNKELEYYKSELKKELERINVFQDKALYISKAQYDNEYKIYQDIWERLHNCIVFSTALYPIMENVPVDDVEKEKYQKEKYQRYVDAYNKFSLTIDKFAPFYKDEFYNDFVEIRNNCSRLGIIFKRYEFDVKYSLSLSLIRNASLTEKEDNEVYVDIPKQLKAIRVKLQKEIREYLIGLQLK